MRKSAEQTPLTQRGFAAADVDADLKYGLESLVCGNRPAVISHCLQRRDEAQSRWAVADLDYRTGAEQHDRRVRQTVAYLENGRWELP